ncbi:hypothetical protein UPYG_G00104300 [Umbra pygmaea]|uniref:Adhesion G protein-coupled receptor E1-like n=1 Tax=Umbra pygmaea TaxID=75934 RepID=A0ABD0XLU1_UMBPY
MSYYAPALLLGSLFIIEAQSYPNGSCDNYTALNQPWRNYIFASTNFPGFPMNIDRLLTNQWNESDTPTRGNACPYYAACCAYPISIDVAYCSYGGFYVFRQIGSHADNYMGYVTSHSNCTSSSCGLFAECSTTSIGGCQCLSGYQIPAGHLPVNDSYGCQDINECVVTPNICGSYSNCTNLPGTYNCSCLDGFAPSNPALAFNPSTNPCTDINECLDPQKACGDYATCANTVGSHICTCFTGFEHDGPFDCQDIDECFNSTICGPECVCNNTPGSYNCTCLSGFKTTYQSKPSKTNPCLDIDECLNATICGPAAKCNNTYGSYICACLSGYQLTNPDVPASPLSPCIDINECVETPGVCGQNAVCTNVPGSFYCFCGKGYYASTGLVWKMDVTVCKNFESLLAEVAPQEGQSKQMSFLNQMNQQLLSNPNAVLPVGLVTNTLNAALAVSGITANQTQQSNTAQGTTGPEQQNGVTGTVVLSISERLVNALVNTTDGQTNSTIQTPIMDISWQVVDGKSTFMPSLKVSNNTMDIDLPAVARNNNGTASAVFLSINGMENLLGANLLPTDNNTEMFSDIVTATLPRINHTQLSEPVNFTLFHKRSAPEFALRTCVYWDNGGSEGNTRRWSEDGCWVSYTDDNYTVCSCSHLSTFALIMQTGKTDSQDDPFLDLVNNVCVIVGLVFLALAILTFLFCSWNPKINNTARLHLCICLFLSQLLLLLDYVFIHHKLACSIMAGLLHFLVVASFMWMLLEALQLHLLVRRLSKIQVIQREGLQKKYLYLIGYGIPLVIVAVSAAVRPGGYGGTTVCWLKPIYYFNWAVLGPVCVILAMNWILFCVTIWSLRPTLANMKSDVSQSKDTRLIIFKILAQFVILGCTWVLGLFQSTMVFKYLFIVLNSQQGTFLYIVHCLFNKEVRDEYRRWLGCPAKSSTQDSMKETPTVSEDLNRASEEKEKKKQPDK